MNSERRRSIRQFGENIRAKLQLNVPVDVDRAVRQLGGNVRLEQTDEPEALVRALPPENAHKFEVVISAQVADNRRRVSIAHEIGHLFLHMGFLTDRWRDNTVYQDNVMFRFGYSQEEAEANEFAATLLMPEEAFRTKVDALAIDGKVDLEELANFFQVSVDAARLRGRFLGLFTWER